MSLIKIINEGDKLLFNLPGGSQISMSLKAKAGRQAVLEINADRDIGIITVSPEKVWVGAPNSECK